MKKFLSIILLSTIFGSTVCASRTGMMPTTLKDLIVANNTVRLLDTKRDFLIDMAKDNENKISIYITVFNKQSRVSSMLFRFHILKVADFNTSLLQRVLYFRAKKNAATDSTTRKKWQKILNNTKTLQKIMLTENKSQFKNKNLQAIYTRLHDSITKEV